MYACAATPRLQATALTGQLMHALPACLHYLHTAMHIRRMRVEAVAATAHKHLLLRRQCLNSPVLHHHKPGSHCYCACRPSGLSSILEGSCCPSHAENLAGRRAVLLYLIDSQGLDGGDPALLA